jgi:hypothetical protein
MPTYAQVSRCSKKCQAAGVNGPDEMSFAFAATAAR